MDQRYVDTVRALKVILRNLEPLQESITPGQREELQRLILKLQARLLEFVDEHDKDQGLWVGEE